MAQNERKISKHFYRLAIIVSVGLFLLTTIGGLYYVYSIKRESAINVAKVVEGMLRVNRYREAIYSLSNVKMGSFDAIGYYDHDNKRVFILPPTLGPDYFDEDKGFFKKLSTTNIPVTIYFDEEGHDKAGTIIFTYNHTAAAKALFFFYIMGIAFILPVLNKFKRLVRRSVERDLLEEKNNGIKETVRQVWHDLNQPMQLLYVLVERGRGLDIEVREKIKSACDDMRSILDDLKEKRNNDGEISSICLAAALKEISEKESVKLSLENKPVILTVEENALNAFSMVNEGGLKRVITNLVDNAALSSEKGKAIRIILSQQGNWNVIKIIDEGAGIKEEHLAMIGRRGVSFREHGNGLGLSYAIEKAEEWKGKFDLKSSFGLGTTVEILLPQVGIPDWFCGSLSLSGIKEFVLTDDRPVIHTLVKEQLNRNGQNLKQVFHHSVEGFASWYEQSNGTLSSPLFVFDYDLGEGNVTGLDVIGRLNLANKSVLMTNYYDDPRIQLEASRAKVKIYPKGLIEYLGVAL
ncbi:MAG: hypothetical protein COW00_08390 [Bdellovibrio sp. CG12_big_fil_rev_8_21_14_0_65_39_13]|nr:MAG: hypothetical protein COW78_10965 [Bdellovibrio sp. CG22_combo_CG10-13_8_21_14_all_39_27]PIQ59873.1 MAG: hypothetical protein COW00_08390 [Bdellovibrio sp. CG12_big_fil_rev_8_21_14_0_65_39_13]PIR32811.1 MAG: hypothetical protein COV37_18655 [Bdellovibrio sp. CG11_big_fil_rev_8_21_14_0_20_39_38]